MRKINTVVIHAAATPPSMQVGAAEIRRWHLDRGWSDIGYHYVIRRNGKVEDGRPVSRAGAHVRGFNQHSIGVCLVGGVDKNRNPADNYTKKQLAALMRLVRQLRADHDIVSVVGHRDFPRVNKACPSFSVAGWIHANL